MAISQYLCLFMRLSHLEAEIYDMSYFLASLLCDVLFAWNELAGSFSSRASDRKRVIGCISSCESWENFPSAQETHILLKPEKQLECYLFWHKNVCAVTLRLRLLSFCSVMNFVFIFMHELHRSIWGWSRFCACASASPGNCSGDGRLHWRRHLQRFAWCWFQKEGFCLHPAWTRNTTSFLGHVSEGQDARRTPQGEPEPPTSSFCIAIWILSLKSESKF